MPGKLTEIWTSLYLKKTCNIFSVTWTKLALNKESIRRHYCNLNTSHSSPIVAKLKRLCPMSCLRLEQLQNWWNLKSYPWCRSLHTVDVWDHQVTKSDYPQTVWLWSSDVDDQTEEFHYVSFLLFKQNWASLRNVMVGTSWVSLTLLLSTCQHLFWQKTWLTLSAAAAFTYSVKPNFPGGMWTSSI